MKGKLIVIDGTDGAGKTTQINLLSRWLKEKKIAYEVISFPRYGQNQYAKLVKKYLEGEYGSINKVDSYKISKFYAGDRLLAKPLIEKWLSRGKLVLANRYVSSNKAHMGANLPAKEREKFFKWLDKLEYETNGIPKEDLTILLDVDPKVGQKNVLSKQKPDLHEDSLAHLEQANKIYLQLSGAEPNWQVVNCMQNGQMRSKEDIHREIMNILNSKIF
ncbi:MAG: thymidylate kinase [Microgenomates group bacterium Gr01-1014_7]|nr:MAG: thymidylate kinase [Microgenomates group bacterium Gr01-1014_7]